MSPEYECHECGEVITYDTSHAIRYGEESHDVCDNCARVIVDDVDPCRGCGNPAAHPDYPPLYVRGSDR